MERKTTSFQGEIFGMFRQLGKSSVKLMEVFSEPTTEQIKINKGQLPKKDYPYYDIPLK